MILKLHRTIKYIPKDKYGILIWLFSRIETTLEKQLKEERLKELETSYYGANTCIPPKNGSFYNLYVIKLTKIMLFDIISNILRLPIIIYISNFEISVLA